MHLHLKGRRHTAERDFTHAEIDRYLHAADHLKDGWLSGETMGRAILALERPRPLPPGSVTPSRELMWGFGLHCVQSLMVDKGLPWAAIRRVHVKFDKLIEGERAHDIDMYVDVPNEWLATLDRINAQSQAAGQPHQILILSKEDGAHRHSASKREQK
jgi:hypothetical protein